MHWIFVAHLQLWAGIFLGGFLGFMYGAVVKAKTLADYQYVTGKLDAALLDVEFWKKKTLDAAVVAVTQAAPAPTTTPTPAPAPATTGRRDLPTAFKPNNAQ